MYKILFLSSLLLLTFSGCNEKKEPPKSVASGMKCGAGKCGANMFDGNSALAKKKKNMLSQMNKNDNRKNCVIAASTTKKAYECVRDKTSGKLSLEYPSKSMNIGSIMKCGVGKCG